MKLKEMKKSGAPADRLQASFEKCWADTRAHNAGRDTKYDARRKQMLANLGTRIALLQTTSAAKKRNTDLAFLIGGNDTAMDEGLVRRSSPSHPPPSVDCVVLPFDDVHSGERNYAARGGAEGTADEPILV
jgi:hypothetical protein